MILVTGANGNVGRLVLRQLIADGRTVRALSRNPEQAQWPDLAEVAPGDLADPASLRTALDGVEAAYLFPAPGTGPGFVAAAEAAGVRRVVLLSSGAVEDRTDPPTDPIALYHWEIEQALRSSDLAWTILRPEVFAANSLQWAAQTRAGDEIRGAYADAAATPIHEADIAACAVAALTGPGHSGAVHHLTGPQSLTHADQARIIGEVLGRPVRYLELPPATAREQLAPYVPAPILDSILTLWAESVGNPRPVTDAVAKITGRTPRSYADWVSDHAGEF
ncbi:NAD(P)H-binding protein [Streptacidiphilus sp. N1-12]|uniref:NAD(P)H-binding protein n=2 Tax=Streptacidiphilus alkalitolerans TaxID=3342712 RepID=A0ABV6VA38_9ACTN